MDRFFVNRLFDSFKDKKILIIGDVMIDAYMWGDVNRISPEAPVPVVSVMQKEYRLGGAANVAKNIKSLDAMPIICSVVGNDESGKMFNNLLMQAGMSNEGIVMSTNRPTTVKTRVISSNQQLLRIDEEKTAFISKEDYNNLINRMIYLLDNENIAGIIFEDYDKGVISKELISTIVAKAKENDIFVSVDPKRKNFNYYQNVSLFKPNLKEIKEGLNKQITVNDKDSFVEIAYDFLIENDFDNLLVTLSEHGIFGITKDKQYQFIPSEKRSIADVSGAGDTVISVATLCMIGGATLFDAAFISNIAGGLVCEKVGVVPIDKAELYDEVISRIV